MVVIFWFEQDSFAISLKYHCFKMFGAHNRTHTGSSGATPLVIRDQCKLNLLFSGRADNDGARFAKVFLQDAWKEYLLARLRLKTSCG